MVVLLLWKICVNYVFVMSSRLVVNCCEKANQFLIVATFLTLHMLNNSIGYFYIAMEDGKLTLLTTHLFH